MVQLQSINHNSRVPKYLQIANYLVAGIKNDTIPNGDKLPSINYLSSNCNVSRDTVEKAYRELINEGLVEAVHGKGFFIKNIGSLPQQRILLLFNKLSAHKKTIYDEFVRKVGDRVRIDFQVYNNDFPLFKRILEEAKDRYHYYVIIPHFYTQFCDAKSVISKIPSDKLLLLDKRLEGIPGHFASVYQDFEENIYEALKQAAGLLRKYDNLKLVFPANSYQPREIIKGFQRFAIEYGFTGRLVSNLVNETLAPGNAYITMMEDDLVELVKKIRQSDLKVGKEVGILSYNENPLKEVLLGGITVISTDFARLGATAADLVLNQETRQIKNPFELIVRNSL
ncbi:MAG: GntR family transcriptional regulator [Phaeodactylibacter sp.]|uniref:GntR family transcriptional regulator n=1 Tax=Phaeodactylibacter sp. TaxID=1940289 RepID=UPI0032ED2C98